MTAAPSGAPALTVEHLSITLPDGRQLFDEADLRIGPGEFVVLVGPSGSGKTTLLRHIAGLDDPDDTDLSISGRIEIGAHVPSESACPVEHGEAGVRPCRVGMVFQNHALFDELSAVENVRFALDHRPDARHVDANLAEKLLTELRVPLRGKLATLSGGERQRVAVARTLAMDPPVLLFGSPPKKLLT